MRSPTATPIWDSSNYQELIQAGYEIAGEKIFSWVEASQPEFVLSGLTDDERKRILAANQLLLAFVNLPFLQPVFNTHFLNSTEWVVILGLAFLPAIVEEITKAYLRWQDGRRAMVVA